MVLICNSLMMHDIVHLFLCLFVMCLPPLVRCLFKSLFYFLLRLLIFLTSSFKDSLYILNDSPVSVVSLTKYFPLIYGLSFYSLSSIFHRGEMFNFKVKVINYFSNGLCFWCFISKVITKLKITSIFSCCLLGVL